MTSPSVSLEQRFWVKVQKSDGCWLWIGAGAKFNGERYGTLNYRGRHYGAHQIAWIITHGVIPDSQYVLHTCDNKLCVRPDHLFLGTQIDNIKDMVSKGRSRMQSQPWTILRGSQQNQAKLSEIDVLEIKKSLSNGIQKSVLAKQFGVSHSCISSIAFGRRWKHVKEQI